MENFSFSIINLFSFLFHFLFENSCLKIIANLFLHFCYQKQRMMVYFRKNQYFYMESHFHLNINKKRSVLGVDLDDGVWRNFLKISYLHKFFNHYLVLNFIKCFIKKLTFYKTTTKSMLQTSNNEDFPKSQKRHY